MNWFFKSSHIEKFDQKIEIILICLLKKVGSESISGIDFFDYIDFFWFCWFAGFCGSKHQGPSTDTYRKIHSTIQLPPWKRPTFAPWKGSLEKETWNKSPWKRYLEKDTFPKAMSHQGRSLGHEGWFVLPIPLKNLFWHVSHPCPWKRMWSSR